MIESLSSFSILVAIITLVVSITIHEAVHAYVGYALGDHTAKHEGRITLNPLKHVDPFATIILPVITLILFKMPILAAKPVPFNPHNVRGAEFGGALIAVAGPLSNLVLAGLGAMFIQILNGSVSVEVIQALTIFTVINIGLFVFNMVPIPPLDGSRLLYAFAPEGLQRVMASMEQFGIVIIFTIVLMVPAFGQLLSDINRSIFQFLL